MGRILAPGIIEGALEGYQEAGVTYALLTQRVIFGDDMGVGKTLQAIATLEYSGAYPAVVVCPPSLTVNWRNEIMRAIPRRGVEIASGRKVGPTLADIVVVGWSNLEAWSEALRERGLRAVVFDESHYAKNGASDRGRAARALADGVPWRLCLSGTPMPNDPTDIIHQLQIIGRLQDVAPTPAGGRDDARAWEQSFRDAFSTEKGRTWLNERLRATCYIRRERADVLGLKPTSWETVLLDTTDEMVAYRLAERDLVGFASTMRGAEAGRSALRTKCRNLFATLERLAGLAKVPATIRWIEEMVSDEEPVIVFADHVDVQEAIANHFDCPRILGGQRDAEEQKARFMSGESNVIVMSLRAAKEGHTLTRARHVVFVERPWTQADLDQAACRANRRGQMRDVYAWFLEVPDSVDQHKAAVVARKGLACRQATVGEMIDEVIEEMMMKESAK